MNYNWEPTEEGKKLVYRHLSLGNTTLEGEIHIKRTSRNWIEVRMESHGVLIKTASMPLRKSDELHITNMLIEISGDME